MGELRIPIHADNSLARRWVLVGKTHGGGVSSSRRVVVGGSPAALKRNFGVRNLAVRKGTYGQSGDHFEELFHLIYMMMSARG